MSWYLAPGIAASGVLLGVYVGVIIDARRSRKGRPR